MIAWIWHRFRRDEAGAVTVDWVVLTAAILFLSLAVISIIHGAATDMTTGTGARLGDASVPVVTFQ